MKYFQQTTLNPSSSSTLWRTFPHLTTSSLSLGSTPAKKTEVVPHKTQRFSYLPQTLASVFFFFLQWIPNHPPSEHTSDESRTRPRHWKEHVLFHLCLQTAQENNKTATDASCCSVCLCGWECQTSSGLILAIWPLPFASVECFQCVRRRRRRRRACRSCTRTLHTVLMSLRSTSVCHFLCRLTWCQEIPFYNVRHLCHAWKFSFFNTRQKFLMKSLQIKKKNQVFKQTLSLTKLAYC